MFSDEEMNYVAVEKNYYNVRETRKNLSLGGKKHLAQAEHWKLIGKRIETKKFG